MAARVRFMAAIEDLGERRGAQPAQTQAGDGDAQLGGRKVGVEMVDDVFGHAGPAVALGGQLGDAGVAHLHDGELGHHEEGVDDDEEDDADDFERRGIHRCLPGSRRRHGKGSEGTSDVFILLTTSIA